MSSRDTVRVAGVTYLASMAPTHPHKHTPWDQELLAPSTRMSTQEAHRKYLLAKWINEELEKELGRVLDRELLLLIGWLGCSGFCLCLKLHSSIENPCFYTCKFLEELLITLLPSDELNMRAGEVDERKKLKPNPETCPTAIWM